MRVDGVRDRVGVNGFRCVGDRRTCVQGQLTCTSAQRWLAGGMQSWDDTTSGDGVVEVEGEVEGVADGDDVTEADRVPEGVMEMVGVLVADSDRLEEYEPS